MSSTPYFLPDADPEARTRRSALLQAWLPVFLFSCVFALESSSRFGSNHTSQPLHYFLHTFLGTSIDRNWSFTHHILRKFGHFFGYGTLSLVCLRGFKRTLGDLASWEHRNVAAHVLAIGGAFLVAGADEFHQAFLPNRTGTISDVLLDTAGAVSFQLLFIMARQLSVIWDRWQLRSKRSMQPLQSAIVPGL